jgi:hypothetical protein
MLSVVTSLIMLSVIRLNVVMLSVVAPSCILPSILDPVGPLHRKVLVVVLPGRSSLCKH